MDLSEEALARAQENATACGLAERVALRRSSWFSELPPESRFDLIVANPPYLSAEETAQTTPEVQGYEPVKALTAADGGLADLRQILADAPRFLATGGMLALETGIAQHAELARLAANGGFKRTESLPDLTGGARFMLVWMES